MTKLRCDADSRFLYTGPHPKRRGARRKYDDKVNFQDLRRFASLGTMAEADHLHLSTAIVWHVTLKHKRRLVVVVNRQSPSQAALYRTGLHDTEMTKERRAAKRKTAPA